jgi:hypothetical protein
MVERLYSSVCDEWQIWLNILSFIIYKETFLIYDFAPNVYFLSGLYQKDQPTTTREPPYRH